MLPVGFACTSSLGGSESVALGGSSARVEVRGVENWTVEKWAVEDWEEGGE